MKQYLTILAVLTFGALAPVATAAPEAPAAPAVTLPIDPTLSPAEQKAVRTFMLKSMRASVLALQQQAELTNPTVWQMLEASMTSSSTIPLDGLPANYQAYVKEIRALNEYALSHLQGTDKPMDQLTPEDAALMQESLADIQQKTAAIEARYPEVARYLGTAALTQLTQDFITKAGILRKVMAEVMSRQNELQGDQSKVMQLSQQLTMKLLLEEIDKLLAE